ncbi:PEP-CTERM sorting domain-containing protein [Ferribacterium limneticum]|uniref:PEP-CTERM sorting domain-containing protein n=1 Tax=Ferribacterium limneticum TaxID=76259 RepID=UPI001CFB8A94|nr:PEP-CTERM sorting domain-containing protein [Ferribacterium limneticum]UCV29992.1 PEP-CTERM sorting domain-containing protein [Ferribacterium limneticum]UCV33911.1 PEP-CTERM sorting domain-containing protein [Ferribacterium limneticum]
MTFRLKPLAAVFLLAIAAAQANAATVTLDGEHFTISYETEAQYLFGVPRLVDSTLVFGPSGSGFAAKSYGGNNVTNATFSFFITADPGYKVSSFNLYEGGDYMLIGDASVVSLGGELRVKPVGEAVMTAAIRPSLPLTTHTSFERFATTDWDTTASIRPTAKLTSAQVSIENMFYSFASSSQRGYAFIEMKNVELGFVLTPIPEPASYAMLLAGLGMMGFVARRRSQG